MSERVAEHLREVVEVVARLRGPNGCPWDRAQTHQSLVPYLLEEAYELAAALRDGDPAAMKEELGDLLLHVLFHAQIAAEAGQFDIGDVAAALKEKLVRRHPHVFGTERAETPEEVRAQWEEIKREEGKPRGKRAAPKPALLRATKFVEVQEAQGQPVPLGRRIPGPSPAEDPARWVAEVLLEAVAWARRLGVDPELALHRRLEEDHA
ncbi:MAG: MazG family protein [Candidatus Bipolaricaulaceae bacterium]